MGQSSSEAHVFTAVKTVEGRRRPRQERARFTVEAILEAAAVVIDEIGWTRASTNRIAERAGVSIGSLYQYFPNKEAILARLFEQHRREVNEVVREALVVLGQLELPLEAVLRKLFEDLVGLHRRDPVLARVLSTGVPLNSPGVSGSGDPDNDHRELVKLLARRPELRVNNITEAARVLEISVEALTRWMVHQAPPDTDLDAVVDESVAMLAGYLCGSTAPA